VIERFMLRLERKWKAWASSIHRKVEHHGQLARAAEASGDHGRAQAHLDAIDRLVRGPVPTLRARDMVKRLRVKEVRRAL
jgi:hypothetical protein